MERGALTRRIQINSITGLNRYPQQYKALEILAKSLLDNTVDSSGDLRILVYGCATGEEPYTLASSYFTSHGHFIDAVDIDDLVLEKAKNTNPHQRVKYMHTRELLSIENNSYDIIVANSVLCVVPGTKGRQNISTVYPFSRFQQVVDELTRMLRPGGLLAVYNSNYRVTDCSLKHPLIPLLIPGFEESGTVDKYDTKGNRLPGHLQLKDFPASGFLLRLLKSLLIRVGVNRSHDLFYYSYPFSIFLRLANDNL